MIDDMHAKLGKLAEEHALAVEWKGDDYGARKQHYKDMFLAGANHVLAEAATREAALSVAKDTLQEICDDNGWIEGERTRGPNKGKSWLEIARETLAKIDEHLKGKL